jgi:hypothetical protein
MSTPTGAYEVAKAAHEAAKIARMRDAAHTAYAVSDEAHLVAADAAEEARKLTVIADAADDAYYLYAGSEAYYALRESTT